jgi:cobalt/nickel transport protein
MGSLMRLAVYSFFVLIGLNLCSARAHYNMLLPEKHSVKRGEPVTLLYQWGHPFEHQLFDAPAPQKLIALAPDGKMTDLTTKLANAVGFMGDGKQTYRVYTLRFTPEQRGDYVLMLQSCPIWMEEEQLFFHDTVKVILHVQAQKGWDAAPEIRWQLMPLTRPYGLQPGMAFQAAVRLGQLAGQAKDAANLLVEIEHYHAAPPRKLPPDEQITRTAKTDPNGVATCTLTEPGWWCITAQRDAGTRDHEGKAYPVRERTSLWVFVDEPLKFNPSK